MNKPFSPTDRVLLIRSAWIGDFIVCIPFIEHLVTVIGIPRQNIGFLIFNAKSFNPVNACFGTNGFPPENIVVVPPSPGALLARLKNLRQFSKGFDRLCYLPFQSESSRSIAKKRLLFAAMFGLKRRVEGTRNFEGPGIRRSQYLSLLDANGFPELPLNHLDFLELQPAEIQPVEAFIAERRPIAQFAVYASSKLAMKMWPQENYLGMIRWLRSRYQADISLIGGPEDWDYNQSLLEALDDPRVTNLAGRFSIRQTVYLLSQYDLLIGNDGAPLHMGALAQVPVVGLYSRKAPAGMWDPVLSPQMITLQWDVPCRHCGKTQCAKPICMEGLMLVDVIKALEQFLARKLPKGSYVLKEPFES